MQRLLAPELVSPRPLLHPYFLLVLPPMLYESFLGVFGWQVAYLPDWMYLVYGLLWLAALWGIGHGLLVTRSWPPERKTLVLAPLLLLVLIVYANLTYVATQGRYFLPALVAISVLFAFGLAELPRGIGQRAVTLAPVFLLAANVYSLVLVANVFART